MQCATILCRLADAESKARMKAAAGNINAAAKVQSAARDERTRGCAVGRLEFFLNVEAALAIVAFDCGDLIEIQHERR